MGKKDKKKKAGASCLKEGATSLRAIEAMRMLGDAFPGTDKERRNEILVVEAFAMNVGVAAPGGRRQTQILLTGRPHPRMNAECAWLLFYDGEEGNREPEYLEGERRIVIYYPLSFLPSILAILTRKKNRVWCQYREYQKGHRWADVHTWPSPIG